MNELMTFSDAAKFLGVSLATFRGIVKRNELRVEIDPIDARIKLVNRSQIELLKSRSVREVDQTFPTWSEEELAEVLTRLENKPTRSNEEAQAIFANFRNSLKKKYSSNVRASA
jgi:transposase